MKTIPCHFVFVSLAFVAPCLFGAQSAQVSDDASSQSENLIAELSQSQHGSTNLQEDAQTLNTLYAAATKGDPNAESLYADALMLSSDDAATLADAHSLYSDAAARGVPAAHLGLAKELLKERATQANMQAARDQLLQASASGSAEADRLLSKLQSEKTNKTVDVAGAWAYLVRAGQREDAVACVELANAYLSGVWNGIAVPVNADEADRLLVVGSKQGSPEAALELAMRLSRQWSDMTPEEYSESVQQLYFAYLWANNNGDTQLINEIDQLYQQGSINPRTWLRAHYLYEQTINPEPDASLAQADGTLTAKVQQGVRLTQKIEGADNGPTLTLLGFPYDGRYLWDGEVSPGADGSLSVASDDPYWTSAVEMSADATTPYFVKILDGDNAGLTVDVSADWAPGSDRRIVLNGTYASVFSGQTHVAIGQWRSLFSIFGEYNSFGLKPGVKASDADQLILLDTTDQSIERYFFNSSRMAWVRTDAPDKPVEDVILPSWQAIFVLRRAAAPLYLTVDGVSNDVPVSVPIDPGLNLIANVEGRLLQTTTSDAFDESSAVRADKVPLYLYDPKKEALVQTSAVGKTQWWKLLNASASSPIFLNDATAFIFVEDSQSAPYLLQK